MVDRLILDLAADIMEAAKTRPLSPDEVPIYQYAKSIELVFSEGSRVGAQAAAEHRPSAGSSHQVEHRTGEHRAKRTLDASENTDTLAAGVHGGFSHATLPSGERPLLNFEGNHVHSELSKTDT